MKPMISVAIFMLLSSSLVFTANAGTVTTTTKTTVTTVKTTSCYKKHKKYKKQKRHRSYSSNRSYFGSYSSSEARYQNQCPGGAFNCYYDLENNHFRTTELPVSYDDNVKYSCVASEDPASCS